MTTIAHISDLHFGREVSAVIHGLMESLQQVRPDLIIISGDLTQCAQRNEFEAAQTFLQQLDWPYLIVPGNHDLSERNLPERLLFPWNKWRRYISSNLEPVMKNSAFTVIGVNTARRIRLHPDWSRGSISTFQIARVKQELQTTPHDHLRLLAAHHPFWLPPQFEHRELVDRRDTALQAFRQDVDIILGGHVHLAYTQIADGVIISHAGTTFSDRLLMHQTNSFNVIRGDRRQLRLEQMVWRSARFRLAEQQVYKREENGWRVY